MYKEGFTIWVLIGDVAHLSRSITRLDENIARIGGDRAQHMGC